MGKSEAIPPLSRDEPLPGYSLAEWEEYMDAVEACRRGETKTPPPVRICAPDGRIIQMLEYKNGLWGARNIECADPIPYTPPLPKVSQVYFIGGAEGPIKIGEATSPHVRLRDLQSGSPVVLQIFATCGGGPKREREYHKRFAAHRLHGEWFTRCPEIEAEIARLSA